MRKIDVPGSEIQHYVVNVFHEKEKEPFIENQYAPSANNTGNQFVPTSAPNYLVLQPGTSYGWGVYAQGPDDVFGNKAFGLAKRTDFTTSMPFTALDFPADGQIINPFFDTGNIPAFYMRWEPKLNADHYQLEIAREDDVNFSNPFYATDKIEYSHTEAAYLPPAQDGNNTYIWRVTPVGPALTNDLEKPKPGGPSPVHSFTYDYAATKPQLIEFSSVNYLQSGLILEWKPVPGADYYTVSVYDKNSIMLKLLTDVPNGSVSPQHKVLQNNSTTLSDGSIGYRKYFIGNSGGPLTDVTMNPNGYEWTVTAWKTHPLIGDFPGETAKSSYEVRPAAVDITEPDVGELADANVWFNNDFLNPTTLIGTYEWDCPSAPFGFTLNVTRIDLNGVRTLVSSPNLSNETGSGSHTFTDGSLVSPLVFDTDYEVEIFANGRPGSGINGPSSIREFRTPTPPPAPTPPPPPATPPVVQLAQHTIRLELHCNNGADDANQGSVILRSYFLESCTNDNLSALDFTVSTSNNGPGNFYSTGWTEMSISLLLGHTCTYQFTLETKEIGECVNLSYVDVYLDNVKQQSVQVSDQQDGTSTFSLLW